MQWLYNTAAIATLAVHWLYSLPVHWLYSSPAIILLCCVERFLLHLQELEEYKQRLHQLESRFGHDSSQYSGEVKEIEAKFGKGTAK